MSEAPSEIAQTQSHESETAHDRRGWFPIFWGIVALLFGYVLSLGPVTSYYRHRLKQPSTPVIVLYAPIQALHDHSEVARYTIDWYLELWH